jgi:hypothetical protein
MADAINPNVNKAVDMSPSTKSNGPTFLGDQKSSPGMKMSHGLGCQCSDCKCKTKAGMC